jgi:hypothetical protein
MCSWRDYFLLALLGLIMAGLTGNFQKSPGYMDADYYYAGGLQLATGKGFSEPYLWNYLDDPTGLPHPSNAYWMPLASIIAALGMVIAKQLTWSAARIGFLIIAAMIPLVTYKLAYSLTKERNLALISGFFAVFCGFYSVFLPVTDTFGIYLLLGGLFFLVAYRKYNWRNLLLGIIAGLMHFTRADGILWLFIAFLIVIFIPLEINKNPGLLKQITLGLLSVFVGYLGIMGAWFIRNELVFGSILAPGGSSMFWLTGYNQIFSYPPDLISFHAWLQNGLDKAIDVRLWAININLQNTLATQGNIFLLPLIIIGIWIKRKDRLIRIAVFTWFLYLLVMSVVFPFAGARGGYFHSGAALQSIWWSLAPIGLVPLVKWVGKKRNWEIEKATKIFLIGSVGLSILLTGVITFGKLYSISGGWNNWSNENQIYLEVDKFLHISKDPIPPTVIVSNPPGFYLASGLNAIAIPDGVEENTLSVARKFGATYLILEKGSFPDGLNGLYLNPDQFPDFKLFGQVDGVLVFKIKQ